MCGSVFLLGSEAGLPVERQQQLAGMTQAEHRPLTDWRYPEFASRTPGYVLDSLRNEQAEALQAFYLSDSGGDQAALRDRLGDAANPATQATCARRALQAHMLAGLNQWQQPGDASLWLFNHWRQRCRPELPIPMPTEQLLNLLCPPLPFKDNAMTLVETLQTRISEFICCEMDLPPEDIDLDTPLGAFGLGSLAGMKLIGSLEQQFGLRLSPTLVFEHPTIAELALAIAAIAARGEAAHV